MQLSKQFISHYIGAQRQRRSAAHLLTVRQRREETLREYVSRFNKETLTVDDLDDKVSVTAFMSGIQPGKLLFSLAKRPPTDMAELMLRTQKHMNAEDAMTARGETEDGSGLRATRKGRLRPKRTRGAARRARTRGTTRA